MTEDEIKRAILQVCKVAGHDSDINIVGFHAFCDKLKQLGAAIEREACAVIAETPISGEQDDITMQAKDRVAAAIRARGNT